MFDWIPIQSYTPIYYHVLLLVNVFVFIHALRYKINERNNLKVMQITGIFVFAFVLLYMGTRPVHIAFVDMLGYNGRFQAYARGKPITSSKDLMFHSFTWTLAQMVSNRVYFFICAAIYVIPCYVISRKWFQKYWFYAFLMMIGSFSFWAYGVNGIRNGIGTAFFLMALASNKRLIQMLWLFLAVNFHTSMLLPTAALIATWFYNQPKGFYYFWLLSIPLSLMFPGVWESLFASMVEDDRASYLTTEADESKFASTGFRWDFLLYSAIGVFAGTYYLFKKKIEDQTYIRLFNIYLFANAFWILVIRANFSNRFAYLSWFLLALVICYPWLKFYFEKNQHRKLGMIMLAYFGFTYFMGVILKMF